MKNATFYIVSGVLTVAIIILYILHFTSKSPENGAAGNDLSGLLNDSYHYFTNRLRECGFPADQLQFCERSQ